MFHGRAQTTRTQALLGSGDGATFESDGGGHHPAVLAFHGYTGTPSELRPLIDRLAHEGYAVRAPLLPGHGTASTDLQNVRFDEVVEFGRRELERVRQRHARVILAGFSYGSLLALHLAADAGHASWLQGLVLLGNALKLPFYSRGPLAIAARTGRGLPDAYMMKIRAADMRDRVEARRITTYDRQPLRAALEVYRAGKRERARLPDVHCPTLVLHGAHDLVCPPSNAAFAAARLGATDVTTKVYARSAHIIAADVDRLDVQADVLAFLARVARISR